MPSSLFGVNHLIVFRNEPNHFSYPFLIRLPVPLLRFANRRSRVFTFHIVIVRFWPIRFRLPNKFVSLRADGCALRLKKEEEEPGFEPSTLGTV